MPEMTEKQTARWGDLVQEASIYVPGISPDFDQLFTHWDVTWYDEVRPGRGQGMNATWCDGEFYVQVLCGVYGDGSVSVAELSWIHSSEAEDCDCEPCTAERIRESADTEGQK